MAQSRDNHFIPQLYLRNWGFDKKIFVHRLLVPNEQYPLWERLPIKGTAYLKNLYVRIEDDIEYDDFECYFNSRFESPAIVPLNKAIQGEKMNSSDWFVLSDYILSQYVRTPSFYFQIQEWGKKNVESILQKEVDEVVCKLEKREPLTTIKKAEKSLLPVRLDLIKRENDRTELKVTTIIGKNLWLQEVKDLLVPGMGVYELFHHMKWRIVTVADGITWPTCDEPVTIIDAGTGQKCTIREGIAGTNKLIIFPISPYKAIIGTQKSVFAKNFTADMEFSLIIKRAIINNAFMFVYNDREDENIQSFRKRIIDLQEFQRVQNEFYGWYEKYIESEAPYLRTIS